LILKRSIPADSLQAAAFISSDYCACKQFSYRISIWFDSRQNRHL